MAEIERSPSHPFATIPDPRELLLLSLIARLCPPRQRREDSDLCRLVIDGRLQWAVERGEDGTSLLYLPRPARARKLAGCLVLSDD